MQKQTQKQLAKSYKSEISALNKLYNKKLLQHMQAMSRNCRFEITFMLDDQITFLENMFAELTQELSEN